MPSVLYSFRYKIHITDEMFLPAMEFGLRSCACVHVCACVRACVRASVRGCMCVTINSTHDYFLVFLSRSKIMGRSLKKNTKRIKTEWEKKKKKKML